MSYQGAKRDQALQDVKQAAFTTLAAGYNVLVPLPSSDFDQEYTRLEGLRALDQEYTRLAVECTSI